MAGPRLRASLAGLPRYLPGRPAPADPHLTTYKISANENPYPPLPSVVDVVAGAATRMNRYPDLYATELRTAIGRRFDVPPEHVVTGTGSVGVLGQIVQAACEQGDEVVFAWRSFEAYPIVVQVCGAGGIRVPLGPGARHDLAAMADAVTPRTRLVLICSPNNPTGPSVHREELDRFLRRVPTDVLIVIDEAYREFVRDPAAADGLDSYREWPNVAVLRTFSKAYGLAGLRVGYAIAHRPVADALRATAVPFGVSVVAQEAAVASLTPDAETELLERVDALVAERLRVQAGLRDQGWELPDTQANFVWMPLGQATNEFAEACQRAGLIVRAFAGDGARCTVAEPEANDRLLEVCAGFATARTGRGVPSLLHSGDLRDV